MESEQDHTLKGNLKVNSVVKGKVRLKIKERKRSEQRESGTETHELTSASDDPYQLSPSAKHAAGKEMFTFENQVILVPWKVDQKLNR